MQQSIVETLKSVGFQWDTKTIGIKFEDGLWNVNVMVLNEDGSRKPVFGFLKFGTVEEAVDAKNQLSAA